MQSFIDFLEAIMTSKGSALPVGLAPSFNNQGNQVCLADCIIFYNK